VKFKETGKVYSMPKDHRRNKGNDQVTYLKLKKNLINQMLYCIHTFDTQTNESLNEFIA
jgi:hypothetical protein